MAHRVGRQWRVHAWFKCEVCGKEWGNYKTARDNARKHTEKTGHSTYGEIGTHVEYDGWDAGAGID